MPWPPAACLPPPCSAGSSLGAATGPGALVGSLAIIAVLGGGVALGVSAPGSPLAAPAPSSSQTASALGLGGSDESAAGPTAQPGSAPTDPANTGLGGLGSTGSTSATRWATPWGTPSTASAMP